MIVVGRTRSSHGPKPYSNNKRKNIQVSVGAQWRYIGKISTLHSRKLQRTWWSWQIIGIRVRLCVRIPPLGAARKSSGLDISRKDRAVIIRMFLLVCGLCRRSSRRLRRRVGSRRRCQFDRVDFLRTWRFNHWLLPRRWRLRTCG